MMRHSRDIVVLGGSAGALDAVSVLLKALPAGFPAALFIVLHRQAQTSRDLLTSVIASRTLLPTHTAADEQPFEPAHVYVAPADHHMVIQNGLIRLERSPKEQRFRPCIDVAFKSAAMAYGRRVVATLLSGKYGNDGAAGLWQVRHRGGTTIVQDPDVAEFEAMPQAALDDVPVDYVLPAAQIGQKLRELTSVSAAHVDTNAPRLLIVENESIVATNLRQGLVELGYEVIDWVPSGEAAIELAQREGPDLILMDIKLAGPLNGVDTARRIWQTLQIPIVYCTAHADLETLKAVQTTESYGYVVKLFETVAVRAAIELALARRDKELR